MHRCFQQTHKIILHGAGCLCLLEEAVVQHQVRNTLLQELQGSCGAACPSSIASPTKCAYRNQVYTQANRKTSKSKCCDRQMRCSMPHFFFLILASPQKYPKFELWAAGSRGMRASTDIATWYRMCP